MSPARGTAVRTASASHPLASGRTRLWLCALLGALIASGCSNPLLRTDEMVAYDFGPSAAREGVQRLSKPLLVYDVIAPAWMNSTSIYFRLAYRDASRPQPYAGSRWVTAPAELIGARIRQRLASAGAGVIVPSDGLRAPAALRIELEEFSHLFDAPDRSRVVVRLRASLLSTRALIAQRSFNAEKPAASLNADGGAHALVAASDEVIDKLIDWVSASLRESKD